MSDREAFAERIRLQLVSRYHGAQVVIDPERFALRVTGSGIDATLPLTPLHNAVTREPSRAAALITAFVAGVENQLTPRGFNPFALTRVLWCVRSTAYMQDIARAGDLLQREIAGDLVAFVAEELPGALMRGIPRQEWSAGGLDDAAVAAAADEHTARRFTRLIARIAGAGRVPADGWRMAGDQLFQGSVLLVREVLGALVQRARGDVLLAVPDRGVLLALPSALPSAERFQRRVMREWREGMNPCSHQVLETDGERVRTAARRGTRAGAWVMPWLQE